MWDILKNRKSVFRRPQKNLRILSVGWNESAKKRPEVLSRNTIQQTKRSWPTRAMKITQRREKNIQVFAINLRFVETNAIFDNECGAFLIIFEKQLNYKHDQIRIFSYIKPKKRNLNFQINELGN